MKLNLKMIAVAAAMVAASSAHAELTLANVNGSASSVALVAFNSVTNAYYVRDLGLHLNDFLPSSITTAAGDGGATGNKTPSTGLTYDKTSNASFADTAFSSWLTGQNAADIRWTVTAGDSQTTGANGFARLLLASSISLPTTQTGNYVSNSAVRTASTAVSGLAGQNPGMGLSATGATVLPAFTGGNTILQPASLGLLDAASSLYYFSATTQTGSGPVVANATQFGNAAGFATLTLASNGDLSYVLAPEGVSAVPVPAAAWLLGSGLIGLGGMVRRRKAAKAAA